MHLLYYSGMSGARRLRGNSLFVYLHAERAEAEKNPSVSEKTIKGRCWLAGARADYLCIWPHEGETVKQKKEEV